MQRCLVCSSIWTPTCFPPCDLSQPKKSFFFFLLGQKEGNVFYLCFGFAVQQCCSHIQAAPWELLGLDRIQGDRVITAFATTLEDFCKGACCLILVVERPKCKTNILIFLFFFSPKLAVLDKCCFQPFPPDTLRSS